MLSDQTTTNTSTNGESASAAENVAGEVEVRDIHALTLPPPVSSRQRRRESWEAGSSHGPSTPSSSSDVLSENFTTMSREFNNMVLAGSTLQGGGDAAGGANLGRIGEEFEETNPLAIVPDNSRPMDPVSSPRRENFPSTSGENYGAIEEVSIPMVKKEEAESKIIAWQNAKIAKINNRFKRDEVVINGWESEQVEKATSLLKKVERKLDEKRARAIEKMQNDVATAHRKAEEKRASSEGKRGTKVGRVLELANFMKAVGRPPSKKSFF